MDQYPRSIIKIIGQTLTMVSGGDIPALLDMVSTEYEFMMMKPIENMINDMQKCISNTTCIKWNILQLIYSQWKYKKIKDHDGLNNVHQLMK